jgi:hypothetical protein
MDYDFRYVDGQLSEVRTGFKLPSSDEHWARGFPERSGGMVGRGFGVQGKGAAAPLPLVSYVEARLISSCRPCRRAVG